MHKAKNHSRVFFSSTHHNQGPSKNSTGLGNKFGTEGESDSKLNFSKPTPYPQPDQMFRVRPSLALLETMLRQWESLSSCEGSTYRYHLLLYHASILPSTLIRGNTMIPASPHIKLSLTRTSWSYDWSTRYHKKGPNLRADILPECSSIFPSCSLTIWIRAYPSW